MTSIAARGRSQNQDSFGYAFLNAVNGPGFRTMMCLADGMSRLECAADSSALVVRHALGVGITDGTIPQFLVGTMIVRVNEELLRWARGRNVGTTLTCVICDPDSIHFAHVGDSRLLLVTANGCTCLTEDHTALAEKLKVAHPERAVAKVSRDAQTLTKSLGERSFDEFFVQTSGSNPISLVSPMQLVLCSDGVWTEIDEPEIAQIVSSRDARKAAEDLAQLAFARDPTDDVSAMVIGL